jgi:RNase P/RNase MRP subunit p30
MATISPLEARNTILVDSLLVSCGMPRAELSKTVVLLPNRLLGGRDEYMELTVLPVLDAMPCYL